MTAASAGGGDVALGAIGALDLAVLRGERLTQLPQRLAQISPVAVRLRELRAADEAQRDLAEVRVAVAVRLGVGRARAVSRALPDRAVRVFGADRLVVALDVAPDADLAGRRRVRNQPLADEQVVRLCRVSRYAESLLFGPISPLSATSGCLALGIIPVVQGCRRCAEPAGSSGRPRAHRGVRERSHDTEHVALDTRTGPRAVRCHVTVDSAPSRNHGRQSSRAPAEGPELCRAFRAQDPAEYSNARIDSA